MLYPPSSVQTRLKEFLKKPEDRSPSDWFMHVPASFNLALDIHKTPRQEGRKKWLEWTQGATFAFHRGDRIYDTPKGYLKWDEAMKHIEYCITVDHAKEATPPFQSKKRTVGSVYFSVFRPNAGRTKLECEDQFHLTQDEFVRLLIAGQAGNVNLLGG